MTELTESKKKKVGPVRISKDLHLWLLQEQRRLAAEQLRAGNQEPVETPFREILDGLWRAAGQRSAKGDAKPQSLPVVAPKPANARWHGMLDEILADKEERIGIEKNLQWAVDSIRKKTGPKSKRARAS